MLKTLYFYIFFVLLNFFKTIKAIKQATLLWDMLHDQQLTCNVSFLCGIWKKCSMNVILNKRKITAT